MKTKSPFIAGILMLATLAVADGTKNIKENPAQDRRIQNLEMVAKTKTGLTAIGTGVDELLKAVNDAKASNDKAKMKAALEASAKHLSEMKSHVGECMKHMGDLESFMSSDK